MLPILITIGPLHVYSLSFFVVLAWVVWSLIFWKSLRKEAYEENKVFDLMFGATLVCIVVARTAFIFLHPELFVGSILKPFALWVQPGLAFYPGLIAAVATIIVLGRKKGVRLAHLFDALAFSFPGALVIGSVGTLLGGSVVGIETKLPWAVPIAGYTGLRHPIGGYLALVLLTMLILLTVLELQAKKSDWPLGLLGILFFLLFTPIAFALEFLVVDSVYWGGLRANQWMIFAIFCQTVGAFYVRGGGREFIHNVLNKVYERIWTKSS